MRAMQVEGSPCKVRNQTLACLSPGPPHSTAHQNSKMSARLSKQQLLVPTDD